MLLCQLKMPRLQLPADVQRTRFTEACLGRVCARVVGWFDGDGSTLELPARHNINETDRKKQGSLCICLHIQNEGLRLSTRGVHTRLKA